jgi:hypothetical protein
MIMTGAGNHHPEPKHAESHRAEMVTAWYSPEATRITGQAVPRRHAER